MMCYFETTHEYQTLMEFMGKHDARRKHLEKTIDRTKPSKSNPWANEEILAINKRVEVVRAVRQAHTDGKVRLFQSQVVRKYDWDPRIFQYVVVRRR